MTAMASLVERLKRDAICLTAWSEGSGPFPTTVAGVSKVMAERVSQAADRITALETQLAGADLAVAEQLEVRQRNEARITALEAMCETLAGFARHEGHCGLIGGYGVCTCGLSQALTQYRAMKEKNDG